MAAARCLAGLSTALAVILAIQPQPAVADEKLKREPYDRNAPVLLKADEVTYDRELDIVTARGHVEFSQSDRVLLADSVSYNQKTGVVIASGNVSLMEPSGEVLFADYTELRDQMRDGFARDMRLLLSDNSRAAANSGTRTNGNRTELDRAVYSPCDVCKEHPDHAPLWQIKAIKIIHDQEAQRIEYKDAVMEVYGVPVAYTPYFSHPDPTVPRKSGFLAPTIGHDSHLGLVLQVPYYYVISPSADVLVEPQILTGNPPVMFGEYRQRTDDGRFIVDASFTKGDPEHQTGQNFLGQEMRGHVFGAGRFNVDDNWKWGFDLARTTDNTYLQRYRFSSLDTLTSDTFIQGFHGRSYAEANAFAFQGLLSQDDPGISPYVLPLLQYQYVGEPNERGAYYTLDANALSIYRTRGIQTRRLSSTLGWTVPYVAPAGDVYTLRLQMRGDVYDVSPGLDPTGTTFVHASGGTGRAEPLAALDWRYPFVRSSETTQQLFEPVVSLVATPYGGNPKKIPNEDSQNLEFDDTNLFSINRFPGSDRYDGGPRVSYGLHGALYGLSGGYTDALVGQSVRAHQDSTFPLDTGLDKQISDIVGRVTVVPSPLLDVTNRFRLDRQNLRVHRNEVLLGTGPSYARLSVGYVQIDRQESQTQFGERQELALGTALQFTRFWRLTTTWTRDLSQGSATTLGTSAALRYTDECFDIVFALSRENIRDQDIQPSTSFSVKITLRNLG